MGIHTHEQFVEKNWTLGRLSTSTHKKKFEDIQPSFLWWHVIMCCLWLFLQLVTNFSKFGEGLQLYYN
jgi:uncharacterized protein with PQ loop repeat